MSKHTPGPWTILFEDYGDEIWFGGEGCGMWLVGPAIMGGGASNPATKAQTDADASLISAAPDMFGALQALRAIIHDDLTHERQRQHGEAIAAADAAIAKAKGDA